MKDFFARTAGDLGSKGKSLAFAAETAAREAADAAIDKAATVTGTAVKAYEATCMIVSTVASIGVVFVAVTAPVPTAIGVALLWLMERDLKARFRETDRAVKADRDERRLERVTTLLNKYGSIPETALLETKHVRMYVNSRTGSVVGKVLTGEMKDVLLEDLTDADLARLIEYARDEDTRSILSGLQALRAAATQNVSV